MSIGKTSGSRTRLIMDSALSLDDIRPQKQSLRKTLRDRLKDCSVDDIRQQSEAVWERLILLEEYKKAKSIGLFLSMPKGEIDTDPAIRYAVRDQKDIYVPHVGANFESAEMELIKVVQDRAAPSTVEKTGLFHHQWPKNKWGIPEPPPEMTRQTAQPGDIDVIVVPGLAFDRQGNRLGQGKGYYDRFLARMTSDKTKPLPILIAVALECQLVDDNTKIPVHDHDFPVQFVLLPNETLKMSH